MQIKDIFDAISLAERIGGTACVTITIPVTGQQGVDQLANKERATIKTVMWALNRLQAAAGQPNRDLVRKFLFVRGWIGPTDEVEGWALEHVPTSKSELAVIYAQVVAFEKEQKKK